jgi:hypothetical protein
MHTDAHRIGWPLRPLREEIVWLSKKEGSHTGQATLHLASSSQRVDDPVDILVWSTWPLVMYITRRQMETGTAMSAHVDPAL